MKINKKLLCITSLVICLPILVGLLVWKQLPAQMPTHFGISGQADGYSSKFEAVVILPLILLAMHIFTVVLTVISPKSANVGSKMLQVIYWMIPAVALVVQLSTLVVALGYLNSPSVLIAASISLLFMVIGNYLPKIHQNYIVGIKLPWTLYDEELESDAQVGRKSLGDLWRLVLCDQFYSLDRTLCFYGKCCCNGPCAGCVLLSHVKKEA
ncbi:putative membrane protein [Streptococcus gallinaceus]|nr:putative membrane protein [Streptococcus gallinaceus]MCP1769399.1 putative membrane protein [Streptococcus gallinaceus]